MQRGGKVVVVVYVVVTTVVFVAGANENCPMVAYGSMTGGITAVERPLGPCPGGGEAMSRVLGDVVEQRRVSSNTIEYEDIWVNRAAMSSLSEAVATGSQVVSGDLGPGARGLRAGTRRGMGSWLVVVHVVPQYRQRVSGAESGWLAGGSWMLLSQVASRKRRDRSQRVGSRQGETPQTSVQAADAARLSGQLGWLDSGLRREIARGCWAGVGARWWWWSGEVGSLVVGKGGWVLGKARSGLDSKGKSRTTHARRPSHFLRRDPSRCILIPSHAARRLVSSMQITVVDHGPDLESAQIPCPCRWDRHIDRPFVFRQHPAQPSRLLMRQL